MSARPQVSRQLATTSFTFLARTPPILGDEARQFTLGQAAQLSSDVVTFFEGRATTDVITSLVPWRSSR